MRLLKLSILIYIAGFIVFCGLRVVFVGQSGVAPVVQFDQGFYNEVDFSSGKRNIISAKVKGASGPVAVDQKFEQIANIASATTEFENDEQRARERIKAYEALIQFEQRSGLEGNRNLQLAIGVTPDNFDALVGDLKSYGKLTRLQIDKTDKTNEYRDLQARKVSLEKSRDSLLVLKQREGKIDELINLETRILDLEQQIQGLGVSLGDFDTENEFSTVKLTLREAQERVVASTPFWKKLARAAIWTLQFYTLLWVGLTAVLIAVFVFLKLLSLIVTMVNTLERRMAGNAADDKAV